MKRQVIKGIVICVVLVVIIAVIGGVTVRAHKIREEARAEAEREETLRIQKEKQEAMIQKYLQLAKDHADSEYGIDFIETAGEDQEVLIDEDNQSVEESEESEENTAKDQEEMNTEEELDSEEPEEDADSEENTDSEEEEPEEEPESNSGADENAEPEADTEPKENAGPGTEEPTPQTGQKNDKNEVAINSWGDSMTEGINGLGVSYPLVLGNLTGLPSYNFGISGEDSIQIMNRCLAYGNQSEDIVIIEMGDNGGWSDIDELISQYRTMIQSAGSEKYIIVTSTDDPNDRDQIWGYTDEPIGLNSTWYEEAIGNAFPGHVLFARKYLIQKGLKINNIEPDEADLKRAEFGYISEKLRIVEWDNTHLNAAGYTAQAMGIYEFGKSLGYW